jgi:hypothetical protein
MSRSTALTVLVATAILGGSLVIAAAQLGRGPRFVPVTAGPSPCYVLDRATQRVCWAGPEDERQGDVSCSSMGPRWLR